MIRAGSGAWQSGDLLLGVLAADRPWALAGLPVLLWAWYWLARRPRPQFRFTGGFRWWPEGDAQGRQASSRNLWPRPWALWVALAGLWLAWLGPRLSPVNQPTSWTIVVDGSPSMGLALDGTLTRLEAACAFAETEFDDAEIRWVDAESTPSGEPDWLLYDRPGTLWLTDGQPTIEPRFASWFASGGPAVPGGIWIWQDRMAWWEPGQPLQMRPAPRQWLEWSGPAPGEADGGNPAGGDAPSGQPAWPAAWLRLAEAWANERGLGVRRASTAAASAASSSSLGGPSPGQGSAAEFVALRLTQAPAQAMTPGRQRWELGGYELEVSGSALPGAVLSLWQFASHSGEERVPAACRVSPGQVELQVAGARVRGNRETFAIDFSTALDRARSGPGDVVPERERRAAQGGQHWGALPVDQGAAPPHSPWTPWLALVSVLFLLAAWPGFRKGRSA